MAKILALDLATIRTGYCVGDGRSTPVCGAWIFPHVADDLGALALAYEDYLTAIMDAHRPDLVVYESPILVGSRDRLIVVRKLYGLGWGTELVCARRGVPCMEAGLRRIKKELAGFSGAAKDDMVAAAVKLGIALPTTKAAGREDAADSVGAWLLGLRYADRATSALWDAKLWSSRGAML